jgi:hypothetical protein
MLLFSFDRYNGLRLVFFFLFVLSAILDTHWYEKGGEEVTKTKGHRRSLELGENGWNPQRRNAFRSPLFVLGNSPHIRKRYPYKEGVDSLIHHALTFMYCTEQHNGSKGMD